MALPSDKIEPVSPKAQLRTEMRRRLKAVTPAELATASARLCEAVRAHEFWSGARSIGLFHGLARLGEPDLAELMEVERAFAYPRLAPTGVMEFCLVRQLVELTLQEIALPDGKRLSLVQPDPRLPAMDLTELGLVLVPGLAFTREGQRLGRGGGFYDRLLARLSPPTHTLGVALGCQLVPDLPVEPHDRMLDGVIVA